MSLRVPLRGERSSQTGSQSDDAKIHTKHTPTTKFTSHPLQSLPFSITQIKHYIQMLMVMLFLSNPPFLQNTPSYICPSGGRYARGGPPRRGPVLRRRINTLLRYTFTSYKVMVTLFPTLSQKVMPHYHKVMVTLFTPQSQGYGHTFLAQTHNSYKEVMVTLHGNANTVHSRYDSCYGTGDWHKNSNQ